MSFFDDIESAAKKVASSVHDAVFGEDKKDTSSSTKKDNTSSSSGSTAGSDTHATQTAAKTTTDNTNTHSNDVCDNAFQTAACDIYNLNNLSLFNTPKDSTNANGKLPEFSLSNVDGSGYDAIQAKYFGDQVKNEANLADDALYTQLAGFNAPSSDATTAGTRPDATRTSDTQAQAGGDAQKVGDAQQVGDTAPDGTKTFKKPNGDTFTQGPNGVEHHSKNGGDTHVGKDSIDVHDGNTNIHMDKKNHTVDYTNNKGEKFHFSQKDGHGDYVDGKGNELHVGDDGKMHFKFENGDSVTVGRHWIRQHSHRGGPDLITQKKDDDHPPEQAPDKGTVTSMTNNKGERMLRVADDSGRMYVDVGQKGDRVFNVTDGKGNVTEQIYTWAGSDKFVIHKNGENDIELHRENGKWVGQRIGPDGQREAVNVNDLSINGHKVNENSSTLTITNDTSVQASGSVDTRSAGKDVHVTGSGASAQVQQGDGNTNHITVSGSTTTSRETDAKGNTSTSTMNGQTGTFEHTHAQMQSNGQLGPQQSDAKLNADNSVDMNGNHFGFNSIGDGFQWATSKLNSFGGDVVDIAKGVERACGDVLSWAGDALFGDGFGVDSKGDTYDDGKSLGRAGDGEWGGSGDGGDSGAVASAQGAIAQASAVADAIRSSISGGVITSGQIGELLSLYSQLGALKGEVMAHNGMNLESAAVIGNLDSQQASVSGAIGEAQVATAMQDIAKSLSAAGANPEVIAALERAGAGGNPGAIQKELEDRGLVTNASARIASGDQNSERNANAGSNNPAAA